MSTCPNDRVITTQLYSNDFDFKSEVVKDVFLFSISPRLLRGGRQMGKFRILVLYDSRKCIPRRVFKEFCFCATHVFMFSRKVEGPWPSRSAPQLCGPWMHCPVFVIGPYLWFDVLQRSISFEKPMKYSNGRGYRLRKMIFKWSYISLFSYYKILRIFSYWVSYPSTLVFVVISVKYLSFNKGRVYYIQAAVKWAFRRF